MIVSSWRLAGSVVVTGAVYAVPLVIGFDGFLIHVAVLIAINSILALGLGLLFGYAGQLSMAHAAFYGIGIYAAAKIALHANLSFWWCLPLAALAAMIVAVILSPVLLVALCGLGPFLEREPHGLPYGVKRRLGIALALVTEPVMLLLDEPAAGLSHDERLELRSTLRRLWQKGLSLVLVEHDMELVMNLCQRVVVLHSGQLIHDGSPEDVQRNPEVARVYLGHASVDRTPGP